MWIKCKGFTVTENKDGSFRVRYTDKFRNKRYQADKLSFCEAGEWVWNMANNHDIGREVNHKMCAKWQRSFFEPLNGEIRNTDGEIAVL